MISRLLQVRSVYLKEYGIQRFQIQCNFSQEFTIRQKTPSFRIGKQHRKHSTPNLDILRIRLPLAKKPHHQVSDLGILNL
jgi:hypothetical protein